MNITRWEYLIHVIKNPEVKNLDQALAYFGAGGWEVVTMTSTNKFWNRGINTNDIILVLKRPTTEPADVSLRAPEMYDPSGAAVKDPWALPS